jgi:hypothetical protein
VDKHRLVERKGTLSMAEIIVGNFGSQIASGREEQ